MRLQHGEKANVRTSSTLGSSFHGIGLAKSCSIAAAEAGMVFVTAIISGQEWAKLRNAAQLAFPGEVLARGEIMRRFSLSGAATLKAAIDEVKKKAQREHQATMYVPGSEGDNGGSPW